VVATSGPDGFLFSFRVFFMCRNNSWQRCNISFIPEFILPCAEKPHDKKALLCKLLPWGFAMRHVEKRTTPTQQSFCRVYMGLCRATPAHDKRVATYSVWLNT
jgi:hypothetical protein